jgi:uncharacterized membrane protein YraQ (UPF0718 family)
MKIDKGLILGIVIAGVILLYVKRKWFARVRD